MLTEVQERPFLNLCIAELCILEWMSSSLLTRQRALKIAHMQTEFGVDGYRVRELTQVSKGLGKEDIGGDRGWVVKQFEGEYFIMGIWA